jgi:two-component system chemotaxis response regulator CheB
MELLGGLGRGFPLPIVLVQHMTPSFADAFGTWLASVVPFSTKIVTGRTLLTPGVVYLAPAGRHVLVDSVSAWTDETPPIASHRPSGDVLFTSMANNLCSAGIGVLLTGMGEDGARGLCALREAGGYTIAEHESTAVVYGMPAAGVRMGAVCESLPLPEIAARILELVATKREAA